MEPGVTNEQKDKVINKMTEEKIAELEWFHNHPLYMEAKLLVHKMKNDIYSSNKSNQRRVVG